MRYCLRTLLIVLAVGPVAMQRLAAEEVPFDAAAVVRVTVGLLDREHLSHKPLDDAKSKQWFAAFFAALDPRRLYFLDSDLAELAEYETRLDDLARGGDFKFAESVRTRYRERTAQAAALATRFLAEVSDFSKDEQLPIKFDAYATTNDELASRWRLIIKFEQLIEKPSGRPIDEVRTQLRGRYARIAKSAREMSDKRLCEVYLDALVRCYDPHSTYFGPEGTSIYSHTSGPRPRTLGLRLEQQRGRVVISRIRTSLLNADTERLVGWELLAIRRRDGSTFDLVEIPFVEVDRMTMWGTGSIGDDLEVVLELFNPTTFERRSVPWTRQKRNY